jgi:phosphatidylserine/phosphatidylglycerophosphate/cardiolipin synthase-like enzyme
MRTAQNTLLLQTPYLVLDGGLLKIFKRLRLRNPNIRLAASSNSFGATDSPLAYAANFKMRPAYIKAGINVYEYMQLPEDLRYHLPNYDTLMERNRQSRGLSMHQHDKPFLCIHAKALVVDERMAFVGSFNFDPRSISLNTEVGLLVQDHDFTMAVKQAVERDIQPANSWVVAKRKEPRSMREVSRGLPADTSRKRVDMWPFRHTSGYELKHGATPIPPSVPQFYVNYRDIGAFPGANDSGLAKKKVFTCLSSALSWLVVPLL